MELEVDFFFKMFSISRIFSTRTLRKIAILSTFSFLSTANNLNLTVDLKMNT